MEYVVGSVAALISGNVTPNRPKTLRRALTPTKHQLSPNVTPKSEFVVDRSIFLSPTQQRKKAIVKKSPKRIFQNPDLDATEDSEGNSSQTSPKAEKVKKHLKEELDADGMGKKKSSLLRLSSNKLNKSSDEILPKKRSTNVDDSQVTVGTPKKKKKGGNSGSHVTETNIEANSDNATSEPVDLSSIIDSDVKIPKKKRRKSVAENQIKDTETANTNSPKQDTTTNKNKLSGETTATQDNQENKKSKKCKKKNKKNQNVETKTSGNQDNIQNSAEVQNQNKKKKENRKNKNKQAQKTPLTDPKSQTDEMEIDNITESDSEEIKSSNIPNPNAITEKDSDSEHDSDNEIESENEQENEKVLTNENQPEPSSDEEEEPPGKIKEQTNKRDKEVVMTEDEVKRTLFVGNVPFSSKCKKEIKKIFGQYGQIDTIRIRTIPVKDARVTPKLAIIKNELHPERTTVNVYIKYSDPTSVRKALAENNTVLNGNHLRVSPSDSTGAEHDPRSAVFVGNLPFAVEDDTLRSKFEKCGEITSVRIIRDKKTNAGKGFGYVNFASKDGVELALALSEEDLTIKNRILRVKRCTQQKPGKGKPGGGGNQGGVDRSNQGRGRGNWGNQRGINRSNQGQGRGNWGNQGGINRSNQGQGRGNYGNRGRGGHRGGHRENGNRGGQRHGGGNWSGQGQDGGKWDNQGQGKEEGAARRVMNKRKHQDGTNNEGPPSKVQKNVSQPSKEKKPRKEFVGVTAEKKKKQKFDKGQKKKKALSEILTKKS